MRVYFDNAATTPISEDVLNAMIPVLREQHGNPSSIHSDGRKVRHTIENARKIVANQLNASLGEIFFTSGGTEANNMAIKCAIRDLGIKRIITSEIEHHCVLHTVESLEVKNSATVEYIGVDKKGRIDLEGLKTLLASSDVPTLVSLMHANNEIGTVTDMKVISEICDEYNAYYHSDTVQTMGHFPIDVSTTKIHFLSGSAHKFHGPKGVGFIYINGDAMIKPFIDGGAQERNMRGGTENVYGIVGLAKAFELACANMAERHAHIETIRTYLMKQLTNTFDDIAFNGDYDGNYLYTVLSVCFPQSSKSDLMIMLLDMAGISASGGSACSSGAEQGSHVLAAIGSPEGRKTVRFSFSHYNTKEEVDFLIDKLKGIVKRKETLMV